MPSLKIMMLAAVAALSLTVAPASAKSGPQTGTYRATGDISFRFSVKKDACPPGTPANKIYYCFFGIDDPQHLMDCPDQAGYQPDYSDYISFPYNYRIPRNGRIVNVGKGYFSTGVVATTTEFHVKIKRNGKASGWVKKDAITTWGPPATCTTGKLTFTATRGK